MTGPDSVSTNKNHLTIILISYAVFALVFGYAYRYAINPDGVSLLRLAGYVAEGNFQQSVTSGWPPLIIWAIAPFLFFGFDGLTAARIAIALCGGGLVIGSCFLSLRFDLSRNTRFIAILSAALLISFWTIQFIAADVLIAALIVLYIYLVTAPDILNSRKRAFFCGIAGGFSYLAHHSALPSFVVHFPLMLLLIGYTVRDTEGFSLKKILISWGIGMAAFLLIASMWISVMSLKYGHLTISSASPIAHAAVGPSGIDRRPPHFYGGLNKPKNEYAVHVFEDPSGLKFKTWSPFESRAYFMHQFKVIKDNLIYILNHFVNNSPFFTYAFIIGGLILVPVVLLLNPLNNTRKFLYGWVILTLGIYSSGFILILARSPRRFYALMIIYLLLSVHFMEELQNGIRVAISDRRKKLLTYYLLMIFVLAFSLKPVEQLLKSINYIINYEQVNPYKEIADQIGTIQFPSPYAIIRSSQKPDTDYFIAYYLRKQLLGRPLSTDVEGITKELNAADAKSIVVFDNLDIAEDFKNDNRYVYIATIKLKDNKRYEHTVNINIRDHEIITGWDKEVNIFRLK